MSLTFTHKISHQEQPLMLSPVRTDYHLLAQNLDVTHKCTSQIGIGLKSILGLSQDTKHNYSFQFHTGVKPSLVNQNYKK